MVFISVVVVNEAYTGKGPDLAESPAWWSLWLKGLRRVGPRKTVDWTAAAFCFQCVLMEAPCEHCIPFQTAIASHDHDLIMASF